MDEASLLHYDHHSVGFRLYEMSRRGKFIEMECRLVGAGAVEGGRVRNNWHGVSFGSDENV